MGKIDYSAIKPGMILVKQLFMVVVVPPEGKGFWVCGVGPGGEVKDRQGRSKIVPCIGTDEKIAREQFKEACAHSHVVADGKVVLVKFTDGVVELMQESESGAVEVKE